MIDSTSDSYHVPIGMRAAAQALIERIFLADGALDLDGFMAVLAPTVTLRIGSQAPIEGSASVRAAIARLFSMMRSGIEHRLIAAWGDDAQLVYQAEATFHLGDARDITLPYVNVLTRAPEGVSRYCIYIDLGPLR